MLARMPDLRLILRRGFARGLKTAVREEGWGTSVGSLFGVLFLAQVLLMLAIGIHAGLTLLREQTDVRLEILDTATDSQIQDLFQSLQSLPYVEDVLYVTREQAYERQKQRDPQLVAFLSKFGIDNPFPETMGVRLKSLDDYPQLRQFLQQPVFAKTINPEFLTKTTDQESQVFRLIDIVRSAQMFLTLVGAILVIALIFVIVELVRRRALMRSSELFVEQLVGATPLAILTPFCVEILTLLYIAFLLSIAFSGVCLYALPFFVPALASDGSFSLWYGETMSLLRTVLPWLIVLEILLLPVIAAIGTFFALWPRLGAPMLRVS